MYPVKGEKRGPQKGAPFVFSATRAEKRGSGPSGLVSKTLFSAAPYSALSLCRRRRGLSPRPLIYILYYTFFF